MLEGEKSGLNKGAPTLKPSNGTSKRSLASAYAFAAAYQWWLAYDAHFTKVLEGNIDGERLIRPISARFMHAKEVQRYEHEQS